MQHHRTQQEQQQPGATELPASDDMARHLNRVDVPVHLRRYAKLLRLGVLPIAALQMMQEDAAVQPDDIYHLLGPFHPDLQVRVCR